MEKQIKLSPEDEGEREKKERKKTEKGMEEKGDKKTRGSNEGEKR